MSEGARLLLFASTLRRHGLRGPVSHLAHRYAADIEAVVAERDTLLVQNDNLWREVDRLNGVVGEFVDYAVTKRLEERESATIIAFPAGPGALAGIVA